MDRQALFQELDHALCFAERPSRLLERLRSTGALHQLPELAALPGVQQNPEYHPEGDVWIHTLMVVDEAALLREHLTLEEASWTRVLLWAALCHDLGKPRCTVLVEGRWKSPGHDAAGVTPTKQLLEGLGAPPALTDPVCRLVLDHLAPHFFAEQRTSAAGIRRLLARLGPVPLWLLVRLGQADSFGRTTEQARRREYPSGEWLLHRAAGLPPPPEPQPEAPPPLLLGRHLLALGYQPGPTLGHLLKRAYEAQLAGLFEDLEGALRWVQSDRSGS